MTGGDCCGGVPGIFTGVGILTNETRKECGRNSARVG